LSLEGRGEWIGIFHEVRTFYKSESLGKENVKCSRLVVDLVGGISAGDLAGPSVIKIHCHDLDMLDRG